MMIGTWMINDSNFVCGQVRYMRENDGTESRSQQGTGKGVWSVRDYEIANGAGGKSSWE